MKKKNKNKKGNVEKAVPYVTGEKTSFDGSIFNEHCKNELRELDKHDIIVKICEIIGPCPTNLCKAEELFEQMKYEIANYVVHHEYNSVNGITTELLLWLDSKTNPAHVRKLNNFIRKYLK